MRSANGGRELINKYQDILSFEINELNLPTVYHWNAKQKKKITLSAEKAGYKTFDLDILF